MALTDAQKTQLQTAVNIKISDAKSRTSTFFTEDKFYELLKSSISFAEIEKGQCSNKHFSELYDLVIKPDSEFHIEKDNISEAQTYVCSLIQKHIEAYYRDLEQAKLAIRRAEEEKEKEKIETQRKLDKLIEESSCFFPFAISEDAFNNQHEIIRMSKHTILVDCRPRGMFANYDFHGKDDTEKLQKAINQHTNDNYTEAGRGAVSIIFKFKSHKDFKTFSSDPQKNLHLIDKYYTPISPNKDLYGANDTQLKEYDGANLATIKKEQTDPSITPLLCEIEKLIRYLENQLHRLSQKNKKSKFYSFSQKLDNLYKYKDKIEKRHYYLLQESINSENIVAEIDNYKKSIKYIAIEHQDRGLKYMIKFNFWRNPKSLNDFHAAFPDQPVNHQENRRLLGN